MLKDREAYEKFRDKYIELKNLSWKTTETDFVSYFEKHNAIHDELSSIGVPPLPEVWKQLISSLGLPHSIQHEAFAFQPHAGVDPKSKLGILNKSIYLSMYNSRPQSSSSSEPSSPPSEPSLRDFVPTLTPPSRNTGTEEVAEPENSASLPTDPASGREILPPTHPVESERSADEPAETDGVLPRSK